MIQSTLYFTKINEALMSEQISLKSLLSFFEKAHEIIAQVSSYEDFEEQLSSIIVPEELKSFYFINHNNLEKPPQLDACYNVAWGYSSEEVEMYELSSSLLESALFLWLTDHLTIDLFYGVWRKGYLENFLTSNYRILGILGLMISSNEKELTWDKIMEANFTLHKKLGVAPLFPSEIISSFSGAPS